MPAAWYWSQPQSENGESRSSWKPSVRSTKTRAACDRVGLEQQDEEGGDCRSREAEHEPAHRGAASRSGTRARAVRAAGPRTSSSRRAPRPPPSPGRGRQPEAPDQERGHDRVVRVRVRRVERERIRRPRERQRRRQPRRRRSAGRRVASPARQSASKRSEVAMSGPELVPLARPAEDRVSGYIREVGDRPVGVAARVGRLAAPVRLDPLANLSLRVRRAAGRPVVLHRHVPVRHLAVGDPVGADDTREADVDHAALRLDVEADPESRQKTAAAEAARRARRAATSAAAGHAGRSRDSGRAGRRGAGRRAGAPEDLALVEEAEARSKTRAARAGRGFGA